MIVLRMAFRGGRGMAAVRRLGARVVLVLHSGSDAHRGRSEMSAHATSMTTIGEVAVRVAARPPGRW